MTQEHRSWGSNMIQLQLEIHKKAPDSLPDSDSQNGLNGSCHHVVLRAFGVLALIIVAPGAARFGIPSRYSSSFFLPHEITASMNLWD